MVETFYVHLDFADKNGKNSWSINLPFLCTKCGVCCTLENFLTAGKINDPQNTRPDVQAKFKALTEELGKIFDQDEAKYDQHIASNLCPYLAADKVCAIYEIRPDGCKLYPYTKFGMQATDCKSLTRFKKQKTALKKGRHCTETYHRTGTENGITNIIKPAKFTLKQYDACVAKLRRADMTDDELNLFNCLNRYR